MNLLSNLTIGENVMLGHEVRGAFGINWKKTNQEARTALAAMDLGHLDPRAPLSSISIALQQLVAISRAMVVKCKVLILDEPTSSLDDNEVAQLFKVTSTISKDGRVRTYIVEGQLFYGSVEDFMNAFDFKEALDRVVIDVSAAHIWDISSVQALDMAVLKFRRDGAEVEIIGMNQASETIVDKLATHDKPGAMDKLMAH